MISLKDIRQAVNRQLGKTGVEINSRDVSEGFNRPSFFVQLDNVNRSGYEAQVEKSLTVRIYYFPSDRYEYSIEVLDMQETIENLFDLKLRVKDRQLNVDEFTAFLNDGVLNCSFDVKFYSARVTDYDYIISVDEDGKSFEVPIDEEGNPLTDKEGREIPVELMGILDIENTKE